jgi:prepilin peptidase CpaA
MALNLIHLSIFAFFPTLMALSASMDLLTFTIPNRICVALALGYVIFALLLGVPAVNILLNMSCGLAILLVTFGMFSFGWLGGGDAKLAAATAAWLGWTAILDYGLAAALFGGILTLILLGLRTVPLPAPLARVAWLARLHNASAGVPYGIALAAAGLMQFPNSSIWAAVV